MKAKGITATGFEDAKRFIVKSGSEMVAKETNSIHDSLSSMRNDLIGQGVVQKEENRFVFVEDDAFSSPSTAAGVIQGGSANGRLDWKTENGISLRELQKLAASSTDEDVQSPSSFLKRHT